MRSSAWLAGTSSRAVRSMNNWNLCQGDADVMCTAGTSHESQGKIRNNTFINTDTQISGKFHLRKSLWLSVPVRNVSANVTQQQCITP